MDPWGTEEPLLPALSGAEGCSLGWVRQGISDWHLVHEDQLDVTLLLSDPERQNTEEPKYFMAKFINNGDGD